MIINAFFSSLKIKYTSYYVNTVMQYMYTYMKYN